MGNVKDSSKRENNFKSAKNNNEASGIKSVLVYFAAIIPFLIIALVLLYQGKGNKQPSNPSTSQKSIIAEAVSGTDLIIPKDKISETASFYPYKIDNVIMEVFAVKAKDGTIRTALNTCQVCYASGRGYYKQVDDTMVCQNCGNVFDIDQIEKLRNGCNPVPVDSEYKKDDGNNIVIDKSFLEAKKDMFTNWTNGQ